MLARRRLDPYTTAYLILAGVLVVLLGIQTLNQQWSTDFWAHLATVRAFAEHPWHPLQPFTGVDVGDPLLSPYMLVLGLATRWLDADPVRVLAVAGLLNLGLWLFAFRWFVLVVTDNRGAPIWALLATLLAWGIDPWRWSGFFDLGSIGFGLPYPSMFAAAVALLVLASAYRWLSDGGRRHLGVVGVGVPLVLLIHPFTFVWAAIAGLAIVVALARRDRVRRILILAAVTAAGGAIALAWPFYSLLDLAQISRDFDQLHRGLYEHIAARSFLALPGVVALAFRARRNPRDPLFLLFIGAVVVFALGDLFGHWSLGRVFPGVMLAAHVALGAAVASLLSSTTDVGRRRLAATGVAAVLVVGLTGSARGLIRMVPRVLVPERLDDGRLGSIVDPFRPLFDILGQDEVVTSPSLAMPIGGVSGHLLASPVPSFIADDARRMADQAAILDPDTDPADRRALLDADDIRFVVLTPSEAEDLGPALGVVAVVEISTEDYVVFRIE